MYQKYLGAMVRRKAPQKRHDVCFTTSQKRPRMHERGIHARKCPEHVKAGVFSVVRTVSVKTVLSMRNRTKKPAWQSVQ